MSFRSQQVDLSYTEPYFLDKNIAAGIDIFTVKTDPTSNFFSGETPTYGDLCGFRVASLSCVAVASASSR